MVDEDNSTNLSDTKSRFIIRTISFLRNNCTEEEVFTYIENVHKQLEKKQRKIKKYKEKIKKLTRRIKRLDINEEFNEKENESDVTCNDGKGENSSSLTNLVDEIRAAAEAAQNQTGFVYEPTSGLYYDQRTGYYYNAEYGLYYDGNTGCYYKYDQENNKFEFHSQVQTPSSVDHKAAQDTKIDSRTQLKKKSRKRKRESPCKGTDHKESDEPEEGELSSNSDGSVALEEDPHYQDIARKYPPSLRIIVQETNLEKLQVGTLRLITFKGGFLGREGDHDVIIPDVNVSKCHLKFSYDEEKECYVCKDLGSRNGTLLNGKRMSVSQQESEYLDLVHGSVLQISQTKLLCHVHPGNSTCGQCEPGLLTDIEGKESTAKTTMLTHKQQLKKLQQKYGLEREKFVDNRSTTGYNDRAATRRVEVGSSSNTEKTEMASVDCEISSNNKGFKMLSKLGWNKGETLGKSTSKGLLEPISAVSNDGTKALGCDDSVPKVQLSKKTKKKVETWQKTQERYKNVPQTNLYDTSDDDS